ncbi:MAG: hypothetical protein AAF730_10685 [Bacteroidota bacterium]
MRHVLSLAICLSVPTLTIWAQPSTEVYLAPLMHTADSVQVGPLLNISNHDGYDNQPQFEHDSRSILFTSDRTPPTDIYRYIIDGKILTQVTTTAEAEYSPKPIPLTRDFATIRIEADGATQRIWRFDEHGNNPTLAFPDEDSLGYYAWLDTTFVVAFKLGDPTLLRQISLTGQRSLNRATTIGRGFSVIPGTQRVSYVLKRDRWMVRYLQPRNGIDRRIAFLPEGVEDYDWLPDGSGMLAGQDSTLYVWTDALDDWKPVQTFEGLRNITRLDVSPDGQWLTLVAEPLD